MTKEQINLSDQIMEFLEAAEGCISQARALDWKLKDKVASLAIYAKEILQLSEQLNILVNGDFK